MIENKRLQDYITESHELAKEKGFWDTPRNTGELLMLITSELAEALEADRQGKWFRAGIINFLETSGNDSPEDYACIFKNTVKDSVEDEIADAVIRLFDFAGGLNIDLESHIQAKLRYNKTRPVRHGKAY